MSSINRIILILSLIGGILSLHVIYQGLRSSPTAPLRFEPARSPYAHFIAGEGIIEALDENRSLSVVFPELVTKVHCKVGDRVKQGDALFELDTRRLIAELQKALKEESVATTLFENKENNFSYYVRLKDKAAISEQDYAAAKYDRDVAFNQLEAATATVNVIKMDIERSITRAPLDGEILQINVRVGEFANVNPFNGIPLIIFGNTDYYQLRVDIDESEAWRFKKGNHATASIRGNSRFIIPLQFAEVQPLMIPKKSLTGSTIERNDTRVLQVVYRFSREKYPVYIGQLLDVFIQADPYESFP